MRWMKEGLRRIQFQKQSILFFLSTLAFHDAKLVARNLHANQEQKLKSILFTMRVGINHSLNRHSYVILSDKKDIKNLNKRTATYNRGSIDDTRPT